MLIDALCTFVNLAGQAALTTLAANTVGYTDVLDLSTPRDLGPVHLPISMQFTTPPASATGGATINAVLQTSPDNVTWTELFETGQQALSLFGTTTAAKLWLFRGDVPCVTSRYLRIGYTVSAALTAGAITSQIGGAWPRVPNYPRNYVA